MATSQNFLERKFCMKRSGHIDLELLRQPAVPLNDE
jgi:hypothetical protein